MCWVALDCPCVYVKSHILCKMFFHGPVVSRDEQNMNKDHPLPFFMLHLSGNVPVCVVRLASFYGAYCRLYPPCYSTEYHWFMISIMVLLGHIPAAASCTKVENFNFAKHQQADRTSRFLGFCFQDLKSIIPEKKTFSSAHNCVNMNSALCFVHVVSASIFPRWCNQWYSHSASLLHRVGTYSWSGGRGEEQQASTTRHHLLSWYWVYRWEHPLSFQWGFISFTIRAQH